jgi:hypothetical protein
VVHWIISRGYAQSLAGTSKSARDNLDTPRLDQFLISHEVSSVPVRERAVLELMQNYTEVDGHYFSLN